MKKFFKKKVIKTFLFALIFVWLFLWTTPIVFLTVSATEKSESETLTQEAEEKLNETIFEQIGELDLQALQEYIDSLENFTDMNVAERLATYIREDGIDYEEFGKRLLTTLFEKVGAVLPSFACIAAITLLMGMISSLKSGAGGNTSTEMVFLIGYGAALIPLLAVLTECFQTSTDCVSSMQTQMQLIFPLMLTLMAASGGTVSASVCRPAVGFFSTTIVSLIDSVVFPLTVAIIAFSIAGNFAKDLKISKFTVFFKSINKWIIGISISVFGLFLTLQGITSATYDGVARRAAKYAIGNGIPIVGGFLSGGFDLAVAGSTLIKNSLGSLGIFMLVSVLFEPILLLITVNLLLRLTAAIAQPFGDSRVADFLGETAENLHYCTAGLLFTAFLYFLTIVLMICSSEALL